MKADLNRKVMASNYAAAIVRVCAHYGVAETDLLAGTGMDTDPTSIETGMLTIQQVARLTQNALDLTSLPHLGLILGQHLNVTAHGMMGIAAMSSRTVGDALQVACEFYKTRSPIFSATTHVHGDALYFTVEAEADYALVEAENYDPDRVLQFTLEAVFSSFHTIARLLSQNHCDDLTYQFTCPAPAYADEFSAFLGEAVCFDQPFNRISGPAAYAELPNPFYDEATLEKARSDCEGVLEKQRSHTALTQRIREILDSLDQGLPDIEQMAHSLNMSSRTLRRKLQTEGTSYQAIVNSQRLTLAKRLLSQTEMSIIDIACELDFNDPSYFTKMFKRWTGFLPNEYRKQCIF